MSSLTTPLACDPERPRAHEAEAPLFDRMALQYERYAAIHDHICRPWLQQALPAAALRAVDLGCGSGRFTGLLAARSRSTLAVDIARREIEIARTRHPAPGVEYRTCSVLDLSPTSDGLFDLVLSVNAMFHLFSHNDCESVLRHVRSLVAPGGAVVIIDVVAPPTRSLLRQRWRGVDDAARVLLRRRSATDAWLTLRLRQSRTWMEHVRTNRPLTREEFHQLYRRWFPGAQITDRLGGDRFQSGMRWQDPGRPGP